MERTRSSWRPLALAGIAGALLVAGVLWNTRHGREARGVARQDERVPFVEQAIDSVEPTAEAPFGSPLAETSRSPSGGEPIRFPGLLRLPSGVPPDEDAWIVATATVGPMQRVKPDEQGRFELAFEEEPRRIWLSLSARYLYLESRVRWQRGMAHELELRPLLGARLEGRVLLDGHPLTTGKVLSSSGECALEDGRYRFGPLKPGLSSLDYAGPAYLPRPGGASIELLAGKTLVHDLEVLTGASVSGRVLDESGIGIAGAGVQLDARDTVRWPAAAPLAICNAYGAFSLSGLPPGKYDLRAQAPDRLPLVRSLELAEGERHDGLEVALLTGGVIEGRLVWPGGGPAELRLELIHESADPPSWIAGFKPAPRSQRDGSFRLAGLAPGTYGIRVESKDLVVMAEGVEPGTRDLELVLSAVLPLRGRVEDSELHPVTKFRVRARRLAKLHGRQQWIEKKTGSFRDARGQFELQGLDPGVWEVGFETDDFISGNVSVTIPTSEPILLKMTRRFEDG